jgi:ketosteroid isomerase-like protein
MADTNKDIVLVWFEALVKGDPETVLRLMHDDFRYFYPGTMPVAGWWDRDGFFASGQMFAGKLAGPVTMRIGDVTAEDDRVWVEAESEADLVGGGRYENTYVMAFRVKDGKVCEFKEFGDTLMTYEAMDVPEVRGPRKTRTSPIAKVTKSISGASIGSANTG